MGRRVPNHFVKPGVDHSAPIAIKFRAKEDVYEGAIIVVRKSSSAMLDGELASAKDISRCPGRLLVAKYSTPAGYDGIALPWHLRDLEVPGGKDGDLLYLTTKGKVALSPPAGALRVVPVGKVMDVSLKKVLLSVEGITNGYPCIGVHDIPSAPSLHGSFPLTYAFEFKEEKGSRTLKIPTGMVPIDFKVMVIEGGDAEGTSVSLYGNDGDGRGNGTVLAKVALDKLKAGKFSKPITEWKDPKKMIFKAKDILEVRFNGEKNPLNCLAIVTLMKLQ